MKNFLAGKNFALRVFLHSTLLDLEKLGVFTMRVMPYNNQPNFKSINLIQVQKTAFKDSKDLLTVEKIFNDKLNKVSGETSDYKWLSVFEQPLYACIVDEFNRLKVAGRIHINCELDWLSDNLGSPMRKPIDIHYYSFLVYTKENKDTVLNNFNRLIVENKKRIAKVAKNKIREGTTNSYFSLLIKKMEMNNLLMAKLEQITAKEPDNTFVINDISELDGVWEKIEKFDAAA